MVRQSCIYGPHQYGLEDQGWVYWMTICSIFNKTIKIFGDGRQVRDLLHVDDLVRLFYKIFTNKKKLNTNFFNCGGGAMNPLSIIELCKILDILNKKETKIKFKKERKSDQKIFFADNSLLWKTFSWKPKINKLRGIYLLHNWIKSNLNEINKI